MLNRAAQHVHEMLVNNPVISLIGLFLLFSGQVAGVLSSLKFDDITQLKIVDFFVGAVLDADIEYATMALYGFILAIKCWLPIFISGVNPIFAPISLAGYLLRGVMLGIETSLILLGGLWIKIKYAFMLTYLEMLYVYLYTKIGIETYLSASMINACIPSRPCTSDYIMYSRNYIKFAVKWFVICWIAAIIEISVVRTVTLIMI